MSTTANQSYAMAPTKTFWGPCGLKILGVLEVIDATTKNWDMAVQADVASIAWTIYRDVDGTYTSQSTGTFTVSAVIKSTPSTGDIGDFGTAGFNVECELAKSRFTVAGKYAIKIVFTLVSLDEAGNAITVEAWAKPTFTSPV